MGNDFELGARPDNLAFKFLTIYEKLANIVQFNLKENRLCNNQEDIKCGPVT
jgi:hypothetical protein